MKRPTKKSVIIAGVGLLAIVSTVAVLAGANVWGARAPSVSYGSDPRQKITIYPGKTPHSPMVVLVHGGGWRTSVNGGVQNRLGTELQDAGFAVFSVNYRSDGSAPAFPNETDDVVNATRYAIAHAAAYGADPSNVTLLGGSAGAELAAFAAVRLNTTSPGTVRSVVTMSGSFDFAQAVAYWGSRSGQNAQLHLSNQLVALGCASAAKCSLPLEYQWSPDRQVNRANCPAQWLVLNGSHEDQPVVQAGIMTIFLRAAGCNVTERIVPTNQHAFSYWDQVSEEIYSFIRA